MQEAEQGASFHTGSVESAMHGAAEVQRKQMGQAEMATPTPGHTLRYLWPLCPAAPPPPTSRPPKSFPSPLLPSSSFRAAGLDGTFD